jgi:hypothetical protein
MSARITSITGLQNLTGLVSFYADWNSLTSVNLSNLPNLINVDISDNNISGTDENSLTSVNLSGCTALEELRLDDSNFSAGIPDLSGLNSLQFFDMDQCSISGAIDISASSFNALTSFDLSGNDITSITLPEANLSNVNLNDNALTATAVDYTLQWLAGSGVENGTVNLADGTNAIPTENSAAARAILQDRGWEVIVNQSSTTTTTTAAVLSFIGRVGASSNDACNGVNVTLYTTGPLQSGLYPQSGIIVYSDPALTQPVTSAYVASPGINQVWECFNGELYNQQSCG